MILCGNVASVAIGSLNGLVVTAVAVFEFEGLGTCRHCEELMSHTNAEYRFAKRHCMADMAYRGSAKFGVSGTAGDKQAVITSD